MKQKTHVLMNIPSINDPYILNINKILSFQLNKEFENMTLGCRYTELPLS